MLLKSQNKTEKIPKNFFFSSSSFVHSKLMRTVIGFGAQAFELALVFVNDILLFVVVTLIFDFQRYK